MVFPKFYYFFFWTPPMRMHGDIICSSFCHQNYFTKIHISKSHVPRAMRFGQGMDVDDPKVDHGCQGHMSKVKVIRSKNDISSLI